MVKLSAEQLGWRVNTGCGAFAVILSRSLCSVESGTWVLEMVWGMGSAIHGFFVGVSHYSGQKLTLHIDLFFHNQRLNFQGFLHMMIFVPVVWCKKGHFVCLQVAEANKKYIMHDLARPQDGALVSKPHFEHLDFLSRPLITLQYNLVLQNEESK